MLPLPQDYIGSTCELKSLDNRLIAVGRIIKIDHDALEIAAATDEYMQLIQYRLPVKISVHNKIGDRILVGITYLSTDRFARFEEVQPLQDFERRGAFRVNSGVDGILYPLMSEGERTAFEEKLASLPADEASALEEKTFIHVVVVDISLTGIRLNCPIYLHEGERYFIDFTPVDTEMTFGLVVERIIRMPDDTQQYGCRFLDITEKMSDALCRDLFTLQKLEKNRRNNTVSLL
ncbi:PilZ domain-containing protein [Ruminococcaceae bacterium OttesenSCG-928-I18]|nr:PilZ domain-containing protein [Ruminococcaceae bacterium OttesenSCG-928-I18]